MRNMIIHSEDYTPKVILDKENGVFEISGSSLPEDANVFYNPIIEWLHQYGESPNSQTKVIFNLDYINSSSSKKLVDILFVLEKIFKNGANIEVHWTYDKEDDIMESVGLSFKEITSLPFLMMPQ